MTFMPLPAHVIDRLVSTALQEDLGEQGDITSAALFPADHRSTGRIISRQEGVLAGLDVAEAVFRRLDPDVKCEREVAEGESFVSGTTLFRVTGQSRALLAGERTALNFLGRMSGISTLTRTYAEAVADTDVRIVDTRKTTPGLRALEKYAVRVGGGHSHRWGLHDAVMIKDTHLALVGDMERAVRDVRAKVGHTVRIEAEADTLEEARAAVQGGADIVLLDNMTLDMLGKAVVELKGRAVLEASGNISLQTIKDVVAAGVDVISVGRLTHSVVTCDLSMETEKA